MSIDFSVFKNIDFTKPDNLLFLSIFFVIFLAIFSVFLFIVIKIIKELKKLFRRFFNIEAKKLKFDQKGDADFFNNQLHGEKEVLNVPRQKIIGGDFVKYLKLSIKKTEKIKNETADLKTSELENQQNESINNIEIPKQKSIDIFKDGSISRNKLERAIKSNSEVIQAENKADLNLSLAERSKLVKEVFSPILGSSISKTDLKMSIKGLNQKLLSTNNVKDHAKIRKEIKFFKKIGGVK